MSVEALLRRAEHQLDDAGLRGSFLVRNLRSGEELGIEPDREVPAASLVKVPLAVATMERIRRGELDGAEPVTVRPGRSQVSGPTGLSKFGHPATLALDDLIYLSTSLSDNTAADALFTITPPAVVTAMLRALGVPGIQVRHRMDTLSDTPAEQLAPDQTHLAHSLAITAQTAAGGHPVEQLDVSQASSGSARAFVGLLQALWRPSAIAEVVARRVRGLMADNVMRQRLAPDFSSDATRWSSKTGTLLNLRHEIGVVEHADGDVYAVAALTESRVAAASQPQAEACMAHVARILRDQLRGSTRAAARAG